MAYQIEYTIACHCGKVRLINQDNFFFQGHYLPAEHIGISVPLKGCLRADKPVLFAVFDGMGGEERGEMASFLAAQAMDEWMTDSREYVLADACQSANREIVHYAKVHRLSTCGTTAAMLLFDSDGITQCHIGDSRIYRFRNNQMNQLTEDDVFPAFGRRKPPLLQFLGIPETEMQIEPHIIRLDPIIGDVYLICTDGLSDMMPASAMADIIRRAPVPEAAESLLKSALDAGGTDNITFVLIRLVP